MSDTALNKVIQYGTSTDRLAFTPSPASGSQVLYIWYETDNPPNTYVWNGAAWVQINSGSAGNVSSTTTLTNHALIVGRGTTVVDALAGVGTTTQVLHGSTTGDPTFSAVSLANDVSGTLPIASGGTAHTTASGAFDALSPLTTKGDIIGYSSSNIRVAVGTDGQVLTADTTQTAGVKWADAASGGALVLLEQHTASSSATLDFTTAITSTYDDYQIEIIGLIPTTNNTDLQMLVSTDGGSTWANSTYAWMRDADFIGGVGLAPGSSGSDSKFVIFPGLDNSVSDASLDATIRIKHPLNATLSLNYFGQLTTWYQPSSPRFYAICLIGGKWRTATAVNAVRFKMSSGNIASGTIRVYGLKKS